MKIRIAITVCALLFGVLFGGLARAVAAWAVADDIHYGTYDSKTQCEADGTDTAAHPGYTHYECRRSPGNTWELYLIG